MEFWGVEVPAGQPTLCSPGDGMYLHVSQAALGDSKEKSGKGNERVVVRVQVDEIEVVLGTLSEGKCDQMHLDLVFDRDFKISHNSNSSSVYICGYRTEGPEEYDSEDEDEEEEEEEKNAPVPAAVPINDNGAAAGKHSKAGKTDDAAKALAKVTDKAVNAVANAIVKGFEKKAVKKQVVQDDDSDEEDESDEDEMGHPFLSDLASESDGEFDAGDDSDEDMDEDDDDEDDDDEDESDESEEEELKIETPKAGKKRSAAEVTNAAEKKAKTDASPKPGKEAAAEYWQSLIAAGMKGLAPGAGKKGGKAALVTPEAAPKTPTDKGLKPAKTPKGTPTAPPSTPVTEKKIGEHKCTSCSRAFTTESALSQHTAAKHKVAA